MNETPPEALILRCRQSRALVQVVLLVQVVFLEYLMILVQVVLLEHLVLLVQVVFLEHLVLLCNNPYAHYA